jgi:hypothetical protein
MILAIEMPGSASFGIPFEFVDIPAIEYSIIL